ncbi:TIGR04197 family type VII secretion effector [Listeria fleischmannii]|uniref:Type VII secretion effector n=1 Tax=Listeria fleischmannii subsp. fleischmannii TaxID=1671902 RepID=A0A2X3HD64_9LIST|nr:TIGR04197 family type VII secretion effector [Listeria fleischmannii]SQC70623.1 type VII secretion effector [Listeria fleischmannii subsp. fleischmannii]
MRKLADEIISNLDIVQRHIKQIEEALQILTEEKEISLDTETTLQGNGKLLYLQEYEKNNVANLVALIQDDVKLLHRVAEEFEKMDTKRL